MPLASLPEWETELVACGRIVQDGDTSVPGDEPARRFNRYIELVDAVDGSEGIDAAQALVRSIQAVHDYGAYQRTIGKLVFEFPANLVAESIIVELPRLIRELPDWAGELVNMLVQAQGRSAQLVHAFNAALTRSSESEYSCITAFIREQEREGWLEHKPGLLATLPRAQP
jgi:hypothetical protein